MYPGVMVRPEWGRTLSQSGKWRIWTEEGPLYVIYWRLEGQYWLGVCRMVSGHPLRYTHTLHISLITHTPPWAHQWYHSRFTPITTAHNLCTRFNPCHCYSLYIQITATLLFSPDTPEKCVSVPVLCLHSLFVCTTQSQSRWKASTTQTSLPHVRH